MGESAFGFFRIQEKKPISKHGEFYRPEQKRIGVSERKYRKNVLADKAFKNGERAFEKILMVLGFLKHHQIIFVNQFFGKILSEKFFHLGRFLFHHQFQRFAVELGDPASDRILCQIQDLD